MQESLCYLFLELTCNLIDTFSHNDSGNILNTTTNGNIFGNQLFTPQPMKTEVTGPICFPGQTVQPVFQEHQNNQQLFRNSLEDKVQNKLNQSAAPLFARPVEELIQGKPIDTTSSGIYGKVGNETIPQNVNVTELKPDITDITKANNVNIFYKETL